MDMLVGDESSPAEVSDKIKEILYAKASSKIDAIRPDVGNSLFGDEVVDELEVESEEDEEEETQTGDEDVD